MFLQIIFDLTFSMMFISFKMIRLILRSVF